MPRPPDLLHLYRDYSRHVIPIIVTETADVACGNDSVNGDQPEEVEADIGMALDEERQNRVREVVVCRKSPEEFVLKKSQLLLTNLSF